MSPSLVKSGLLRLWPVWACGLAGFGIFQFLGNANRGYIASSSLFVWWGSQWINPLSELQHAWLLLAFAVWLFWRTLRKNDQAPGSEAPSLAGWAALAMVSALVLHGLGFLMQQARLSVLALLLFTWGLLALAGGRRWARASVFPLGLMLWAIPLGFFDSAGFWMRLWVVDASHALARLGGMDLIRSGTRLFSPDGSCQYDVVAACSGVRSLQALLSLSLIAGYLAFRNFAGRALIFALAFPLVYLGNVVRIIAILAAAAIWGPDAGASVHKVSGFLVFAVVLGTLMLAIVLLQRLKPGWSSPETEARLDAAPTRPGGCGPDLFVARTAAAWVLGGALTVSLGLVWLDVHAQAPRAGVRLTRDGLNPVELPFSIGFDWLGGSQTPTQVERELLPPDTGYSRKLYYSRSQPGRAVLFSVVLSGRDRSSIHRPELCLVGQGWSVIGRRLDSFSDPTRRGGRFPATILTVQRTIPGQKAQRPELVAYWFIGSEEIHATQAGRMWADALSRLAGKPQRWAYILVQTDAMDGEELALARIQTVIDGTFPTLKR